MVTKIMSVSIRTRFARRASLNAARKSMANIMRISVRKRLNTENNKFSHQDASSACNSASYIPKTYKQE